MSELYAIGIAELKERYGLQVFVETGCDTGNGLRHAAQVGFQERYSCDINPLAAARCASLGKVHCSDSLTFLRCILPEIADKQTLFWLDAHYPQSYSDTPGLKFPLEQELRILAHKPGIENDVILCDDIRVVRDPKNPAYDPSNFLGHLGNEYYYVDMPLESLTSLLPLNHRILHTQTGVLVFEPC